MITTLFDAHNKIRFHTLFTNNNRLFKLVGLMIISGTSLVCKFFVLPFHTQTYKSSILLDN